MPRKKAFEASEYDALQRESVRDDAIRASQVGPPSTQPKQAPALAVIETPAKKPDTARQPQAVEGKVNLQTKAPAHKGGRPPAKSSSDKEERLEPVKYIKKRFPFTEDEDSDFDAFLGRLRKKSRTRISLATVVRVYVSLGMQIEQELLAELEKDPSPPQPPFSNGHKMAEFEEHWLRLFTRALRNLPQAPRRQIER